MSSLLCDILFSCVLAVPGAKAVDELSYGTALYAYYQQDYQQALLEVMVAERRNYTGDQPVRFQLAGGSFAFQQRMYRLAGGIFDAVAEAELTEQDHRRLAFHLSREYYRRGDWGALQAQLDSIDLGSDWRGRQRRHPEVTFMQAEAAMARGDFAAAEATLAALPPRHEYQAFGLFNLGVAYREAGAAEAAHRAFSRLADLEANSDTGWDLIQRGRLALAVMARQSGELLGAREMLGALPGQGRYRDLALASYGNLAMAQQEHELAARIWLTVLDQPGWSAGHADAYLGLPISLEKLASPAHALERFREAERVYQRRLMSLEQAARHVQDPAWAADLLEVSALPDQQIRARELARFDEVTGSAAWLEWLADEQVHQVMVEWRELRAMSVWLGRLPGRIEAYQQVSRERRRRTAAAAAMLDQEALPDRQLVLAARVQALQADLAALRREPARPDSGWMLRLADAQESQLVRRLDAMSRLVDEHLPAAQRPRFEARLARLRGAAFWSVADSRAARIRAQEQRLNQSRTLLAEVETRIARLSGAEQRFAAGVETQLDALAGRAGDVSTQVADAMVDRRRVIADALERRLRDEMSRTRQYLLTARIAIARATDQLALAAPEAPAAPVAPAAGT